MILSGKSKVTKAVKEATKQGLEQGRKEALAQGIRQKTEEIAKKMFGVLDDRGDDGANPRRIAIIAILSMNG